MALEDAGSKESLRMVLIGKTGVGKSSTGNTIFGGVVFEPGRGMASETQECKWKAVDKNGLRIEVTDTPGVCDTHRTKEEVQKEIAKTVATMTPGPHAIIMVFKGGDRFTHEEEMAYKELKQLFGEGLTKHMILVFTGMDKYKSNQEFSTALSKAPASLQTVLSEASRRYVCFNNEASWPDRQSQANELLSLARQLIAANHGECYSTDLLKKFEDKMKEMVKESGKTRDEIKANIVENNSTFLNRCVGFLKYITPQNICRLM